MKKIYFLIFGLIGVALALSACAGTNQTMTLTVADAGKSVELAAGSTLVIQLEANPTTGYSWEVKDVDASVLKMVGEVQFTPSSTLVGAGGTQVLTFQAAAAGQTHLTLYYDRPWETNSIPLQTFDVDVVVK